MKTSHRTASHIHTNAGPFIGIPMNAPQCSALFLNNLQIIDLVGLIFGGGGVEVLLLTDFPPSSHFARSRIPSSHTSHDLPNTVFFNQPPRHSALTVFLLPGLYPATPHFRTSRSPPTMFFAQLICTQTSRSRSVRLCEHASCCPRPYLHRNSRIRYLT